MLSDNNKISRRYSVRISLQFETLLVRQVNKGKFRTVDEAIEYYSNLGLDLTTRKSENLKRSIENIRLMGKTWGRPPFGLRYKNGIRVEYPPDMNIVRGMYRDSDQGMSLGGLSAKYNKSRQTIRYILMNSVYGELL